MNIAPHPWQYLSSFETFVPQPVHFKICSTFLDGSCQTKIVFKSHVDESSIINKVGEKVGEKIYTQLSEKQKTIIATMLNNPTISAKELSRIIGISQRKIEENIKKLKKKEIIKRIGPDKGGYWKVK